MHNCKGEFTRTNQTKNLVGSCKLKNLTYFYKEKILCHKLRNKSKKKCWNTGRKDWKNFRKEGREMGKHMSRGKLIFSLKNWRNNMEPDVIGCVGSLLGLAGFWVGIFTRNVPLIFLGLFFMVLFFTLAWYIARNNGKK